MAICFQQIVGFKSKHNEMVYEEIKSIIIQLLLFVCAGLTAKPCGIWPRVIRALSEYLDPDERKEFNAILDYDKKLDSAHLLKD